MTTNIVKELAALERMTVGELHNRYAEVFWGAGPQPAQAVPGPADCLADPGQCRWRAQRMGPEPGSGAGR